METLSMTGLSAEAEDELKINPEEIANNKGIINTLHDLFVLMV